MFKIGDQVKTIDNYSLQLKGEVVNIRTGIMQDYYDVEDSFGRVHAIHKNKIEIMEKFKVGDKVIASLSSPTEGEITEVLVGALKGRYKIKSADGNHIVNQIYLTKMELDLTKLLRVGSKVYSTVHGYVTVTHISSGGDFPIRIEDKSLSFDDLSKDGKLYNVEDDECIIFPSKTNRDWNTFTGLRKGDVVLCWNEDSTHKRIAFFHSYDRQNRRYSISFFFDEELTKEGIYTHCELYNPEKLKL